MKNMQFEAAVSALVIAGDTAIAQIGNKLTRFTLDKILETWHPATSMTSLTKITAVSPGTCDARVTKPYVIFATEDPNHYYLRLWDKGHERKVDCDSPVLHICHDPDGCIFVAEKKQISIFKYDEEKGQLRWIETKVIGFKTSAMWLTKKGANHVLFLRDESTEEYKHYQMFSDENSCGELKLGDPILMENRFRHLYSSNEGGITLLDDREMELTIGKRRKYYYTHPLVQVAPWENGIILLFKNGVAAIVKGDKDFGRQRDWIYVDDRPYGKVAVLPKYLLLRRGCTIVFHPLSEKDQ